MEVNGGWWGGQDPHIDIKRHYWTYAPTVAATIKHVGHTIGVAIYLRGGGSGGAHYDIETSGMRFERMFVGVAAAAEMALKTGINFSGVDGTFFKNSVFKDKLVLLQLTTRDGNNQIMPLAWCICKKENSDNYHYFAEQCEKVKYLHHFTGQSVCFSDKSWQFQLLKITDS